MHPIKPFALISLSLGSAILLASGHLTVNSILGNSPSAATKIFGAPKMTHAVSRGEETYYTFSPALVTKTLTENSHIYQLWMQALANNRTPAQIMASFQIPVHGTPQVAKIGQNTTTFTWVEKGYYIFLRKSMIEVWYDDLKPYKFPKGTVVYTMIAKPGKPPKKGGDGKARMSAA